MKITIKRLLKGVTRYNHVCLPLYECLYKIAIYVYMCIQIPRLAVAIMFSCEYEHRNT